MYNEFGIPLRRGVEYCCFGGGGGGQSGKVDYPEYIKNVHANWLANTNQDYATPETIGADKDITSLMATAIGSNPFSAITPYNPDSDITAFLGKLATFEGLTFSSLLSGVLTSTLSAAVAPVEAALNVPYPEALLTASVDAVKDAMGTTEADNWLTGSIPEVDAAVGIGVVNSYLESLMVAYSNQLQADLETKALPAFQRGMQDLNAVMSSSFVIGQAILQAEKNRNVALQLAQSHIHAFDKRTELLQTMVDAKNKMLGHRTALLQSTLEAQLRIVAEKRSLLLASMDVQMRAYTAKISYSQAVANSFIEGYRIKMVAKKEQVDTEMHLEEAEAKWPLEAFTYGCNVMAAIGGASVHTAPKPNRMMSALGGALSGAGAGSMIGGPIGAGIGGLLGLFGGL